MLKKAIQRLFYNSGSHDVLNVASHLDPIHPTHMPNYKRLRLICYIRHGSPLVLDRELSANNFRLPFAICTHTYALILVGSLLSNLHLIGEHELRAPPRLV